MSLSKPNSVITPLTYDVEFRAIPDDAWYSVRTVLEGEKLRIQYENFDEQHDNVFDYSAFKTLNDIEVFEKRFRPISNQLQDKECKSLTRGTLVCVSHSFTGGDNRFYDAVVDDVVHKDHSFDNDNEQCNCIFTVCWQHGPASGFLANKKIESVCLVYHNPRLDSQVANFTKILRSKLKVKSTPSCKLNVQETKSISNCQSLSNSWMSDERIMDYDHQRIKEEVDLGGAGNKCIVLIDNMEKDLSPLTIRQSIYKFTSVSVHVYVFPSLPYESYTNGALVLDCKKSFLKLCEFLDSPNRFIVSRKGRSWVIAAKLSGIDTYTMQRWNLMPNYQNEVEPVSNGNCKDLKVVYSGSEEYITASKMRKLFFEFKEHQQGLHKTLALQERTILQASFTI